MKKLKFLFSFLMLSTFVVAQSGKSNVPSKVAFYQLSNYQKKLILSKNIYKEILVIKPNTNTAVPKKGYKFVKVSNKKGFLVFLVPEETSNDDVKAFFGDRIEHELPDGRILIYWCDCLGQGKCNMRLSSEKHEDGGQKFSCSGTCGSCKEKRGELPKTPNDIPEIFGN